MLKIPKFLKSVRYCLAAVNGLFLFTGLLVLAVSIATLSIYSQYDTFITQWFYTLPRFIIATGVIIIVVSALGFYGAYSEQFYFIAAYVILAIIILIFELAAAITSFNLRSDATSVIRPPMVASRNQYENNRDVAIMWDNLQMGFQCCGVSGRHDWTSNRIPISCCHVDYGSISPFICDTTNAYTTGCVSVLGEYLSHIAHVLAYTMLVVTCLQVLMTIAAGWLCYRSKFEEVELES